MKSYKSKLVADRSEENNKWTHVIDRSVEVFIEKDRTEND